MHYTHIEIKCIVKSIQDAEIVVSSQGATGAAGGHLPTAQREQGDVWGGFRGGAGGPVQALLHLRPVCDTTPPHPPPPSL